MILYFNKNGQLIEKLEYGSVPRAGTTKFQIFAYFDGLQPNDGDYENYAVAMIRLKRPDLEGSEYPDLFMTTSSIVFDSSIEQSKNNTFQNGVVYYGFVFDFSKIRNIEENGFIKLLDISGMWRATITLMNRNSGNYITGLLQFNVEGSVSSRDDEPQQLEYEVIQQNIADLLQSYALKTWVQNNYALKTWVEDNYIPYIGTRDINLGNRQLLFGTGSHIYGEEDELYIHGEEVDLSADYFSAHIEKGSIYLGSTNEFTIDGGMLDFESNVYFNGNAYYRGSELATKDDIAELGIVYRQKGSKTVAQLNYTNLYKQAGDVYDVLNSGVLTAGDVEVVAGDNVVWTTDGVWDKMSGDVDLTIYATTDYVNDKFDDYYTKDEVDSLIGDIEAVLDALDIGTGV